MDIKTRASRTHILLLHYPVLNRKKEIVTTSVTNLDIHDISRLAKSYGIGSYQIVTPISLQQELVNKVIEHWTKGWGAKNNHKRSQAFEQTLVANSLEKALEYIEMLEGEKPLLVATSAQDVPSGEKISYKELLENEKPLVFMFGTGWGMAPELLNKADYILPPVKGPVEYNHLSVRSAVSIIIDRFLGIRI
jgi:hypothetical protein